MPDEIHYCQRLIMTSKDLWGPYVLNGSFSSRTSYIHNNESYVMQVWIPLLMQREVLQNTVEPSATKSQFPTFH